jgi:4-amino-4-deoxy-L-arabinose transferase-like glycosyltransferase
MYTLMGLLLVAVTYCFVRGWRAKSGWGWWIVFGVLAGLAMYTQQLAAFFLVALALVPLIARRFDRIMPVAVGGVVAIIVYLPWLVNLPGQLNKVNSYYWLTAPNIAQPLLTARSFLVVNLDIPAPASMIGLIGALFVMILLALQIVMYLRRRKARTPDRSSVLLALWLAVGTPALMWIVSQVQPVYLERALLPSALLFYIVLAWFFLRSGLPRPIAGLIGLIGLVLAGMGLYYQYTWATFPNSPFQTGAEYIRANWQDGDVVVHQNKLIALPLVYYDRELDQRFLGDLPGSPEDTLALPTQEALQLWAHECVQTAATGGSRVWWVTFDFAEEQYADAGRTEFREALDWLQAHFMLAETQHFNDLQVSLFTDPDVEDAPCQVM